MTTKNTLNSQKHTLILTDTALQLVTELTHHFHHKIDTLLKNRTQFDIMVKNRLQNGELPFKQLSPADYLQKDDTDNWTGPPIPNDLQERHVELTGPASNARMVYNSFTCGADAYMADFEDSLSPTKKNILDGQLNLYHAIRGTLTKDQQALPDNQTTLLVRPRGLHLKDHHFQVDNAPCYGALVDFGLFMANNAQYLIQQGSGPYFYLPKLEHWQESAIWADIFEFTENYLKIPHGSIRATVLIETITAAYEIDAILYSLRHYTAGLNCGRWDYIFSFIKKLGHDPSFILPDRKLIDMSVDFMKNYSLKVVQSCHKRGVHAMGGMSANVPYKPTKSMSEQDQSMLKKRNETILEKIKKDKENEAKNGHDGAWAAHPGLVPEIKSIFQQHLKNNPHQIDMIPTINITDTDLIHVPSNLKSPALITEEGVRTNISIGLQYIIAWLNGIGAVGIGYSPNDQDPYPPRLMEDLATAEISRIQLFQWITHNVTVTMDDNTTVPIQTVIDTLIQEETLRIKNNTQVVKYDITPEIETLKKASHPNQTLIQDKQAHCIQQFNTACDIFKTLCIESPTTDFISLIAYPYI